MAAVAQRTTATEIRTGRDALDLLDERWDELLALQPLPNPTLSSTWLHRLAELDAGEPLVATAEEDGRLVAGAAMQLRRRGGPLGIRVATWLGPVEQLCSPDLLVDPERPAAANAVVAAVLDEADVLVLGAPEHGPAAASLRAVAPWHRADSLGRTWQVEWPPPRLDYARRRAHMELRYATRHGVEVEVRVAVEPDEIAAALVRLFRVHRERWHGREDETLRFARTRELRRWNAGVAYEMATGGRARLAEVVENGRIVGACLGFVHAHGGILHTQAMRRGGTLREPGHIAVLECLAALGEAGAALVELGPGPGQPGGPKTRVGATPAPLHALLAARDPARQRVLETARRLQHTLRA